MSACLRRASTVIPPRRSYAWPRQHVARGGGGGGVNFRSTPSPKLSRQRRHTTRSLRVFSELEAARTHLTPEFEMGRGTSDVRRGTGKFTV